MKPCSLSPFNAGTRRHDIAKLGVSSEILHTPGILDSLECEAIKIHSAIGCLIADTALGGGSLSEGLRVVKEIALFHHERWNGSGYPLGLCSRRGWWF